MDLESLIEELMKKDESKLDVNVLKRKVCGYGWTVAHEMADRGYKFTNKKILKWPDEYGWTVAHLMAMQGHVFKDKEVLKLADESGWTVAHEMAKRGYEFRDKEILKLVDKQGETVAHLMAEQGHVFKDKEILKLRTKRLGSVVEIMASKGNYVDDKEAFELVSKNAFQEGLRGLGFFRITKKVNFVEDTFLKTEEQNLKGCEILKYFNSIVSKKKANLKPFRK